MDRLALCVLCRTDAVDPRWRPFCSRRCQSVDLGRWAEERYRIAGPPDPERLDDEDAQADDHDVI